MGIGDEDRVDLSLSTRYGARGELSGGDGESEETGWTWTTESAAEETVWWKYSASCTTDDGEWTTGTIGGD